MSTTARNVSPAIDASHWPKTTLRITFGAIWLIDAVLKWLPGFRSGYMDTVMGQATGQPGWLRPWFRFWINLQHPHPAFFAYVVAVIETMIAVAVIIGFARKLTYVSAIVFSLLVWGTAEGFGGPYTAGAADIGTAVIYAIVFGFLLLFSYYTGRSAFSVDHYLEQRIRWWHRVAEVEPHSHRIARHLAMASSNVPAREEALALPNDLDLASAERLSSANGHAEPGKVPAASR